MSLFTTSLSATGTSTVCKLPNVQVNWKAYPGISVLVNFSGGGPAVGTVTVQVSNDPNVDSPSASIAATARWNNHDVLVNLTGDANSSVVYPIGYVRLNCTAYTSGTITMQICYVDAT